VRVESRLELSGHVGQRGHGFRAAADDERAIFWESVARSYLETR
jgi:hypothetical protein